MTEPKIVIDIEANAQRIGEKMHQHAVAYRAGIDALRGANTFSVLHYDEPFSSTPAHEMISGVDLDDNEKRWAAALRKVYNVGAPFFEDQPKPKRAAIMKQLTELAEKGRTRAGLKAGELLGVIAEYALEGRVPGTLTVGEFKTKANTSGIAYTDTVKQSDQLELYRWLNGSFQSKEKP